MTAATQPIAAAVPAPKTGVRAYAPFAAAVGLFTIIWLLALSGWFGLTPGSLLTKRNNVMFNSDSSAWIQRFAGEGKQARAKPYIYIHPLEEVFWRPPARAIAHALRLFFPRTHDGVIAADLLAAKLLVALLYGLGVACLALFALYNGVDKVKCGLIFATYLLFTSMSTCILPEHFAISNALLTIAFVVPLFIPGAGIRSVFLGAMTVVCGGTICTNFAFPLGSLIRFFPVSRRLKIRVVGIAVAGAIAAGAILFFSSRSIHWFVLSYSNIRLFRRPFRAVLYVFGMMIYPAIGATPHLYRFPGWDDVTYEPWRINDYSALQLMAAAAWVVLLVRCFLKACKEPKLRANLLALVAWLGYEVLLHNVWGDELLLYAPNWTWALIGIVILGAPYVSRRFLAVLAVPLLAGQIYTLTTIKAVMQTIPR